MLTIVLPNDIAQIVLVYAWAPPLSTREFRLELEYLQTFHECVPEAFLQPTFYDPRVGYCRASPYRKNTPYVPLHNLRFTNIWDGYIVSQFAEVFQPDALRSVKTYRGILTRRVKNLLNTPASHTGWNELVETFSRLHWSHIKSSPPQKELYRLAIDGFRSGRHGPFPDSMILPIAEKVFEERCIAVRRIRGV